MENNGQDTKPQRGGRRPGAGRKRKVEETELKALLNEGWSREDRIAAVRSVGRKAASGNIEAFKALMSYAYGRPPEYVDVTTKGEALTIETFDYMAAINVLAPSDADA